MVVRSHWLGTRTAWVHTDRTMTPDELKQKLRDLGIDPDQPSWVKSKAVDLSQLPIIQQQRDALAKVKELLQAQVQSDEAQIHALQEQMARRKRGGGH